MASNHTQHYELSQWQATDEVIRTDFNADNAKIDAALFGKLGRSQLISTMETQAGDTVLKVDFSQIDWSEWETVTVQFLIPPEKLDDDNSRLDFTLNNGRISGYFNKLSSYFCFLSLRSFQVIFQPCHNAENEIVAPVVGSTCGIAVGIGTFSQLTSMEIKYMSSDYKRFPAGLKLTIWGVR
ncbi:hypothetical protein [uncultured Dysosmobacter sp.]|uniref:hypothetical protein n=1 Tax=uncultured Dysosmobacter sp. TaxID=2591384 RepID=UPI0026126939|nr:hypothetical protein [uncultured Dysosmobacter sp.]